MRKQLLQLLRRKRRVETLKQKDFQKITDTKTPQGISAVFVKPKLDISEIIPLK